MLWSMVKKFDLASESLTYILESAPLSIMVKIVTLWFNFVVKSKDFSVLSIEYED